MPVTIFFCYSHIDELLLIKLKSHLQPLQRQGLIDIWYDRDINAGTEWKSEINQHINAAQIILLLISPDFMASDYINNVELKRALERHKQGEARVIPIILRHVYWQGEPLGDLQALPTDAIPVTDPSWHNLDRALFDVAKGIRKVALNIQKKSQVKNLEKSPQATSPQLQILRKTQAHKMSNKAKAVYISVAVIILAAIIGFLLHSTNPITGTNPTSTVTLTKTATKTPTSTVTPTPTPTTPILIRPKTPFLADSMTGPSNQDQWDTINNPHTFCGFNKGGYDFKVAANGLFGCSTNASDTNFTNFIYEIKMTIVSGVTSVTSNTHGAGLMFRYVNPGGNDASNYGISFQQDGSYYMFVYKNQLLEGTLGEGHCASFHTGANQTNLIDIVDNGPTIELFVNNIYVMTATDSQFQSGYIGVQMSTGNDPGEVVFNDLKVWKL